MKKRSEVSRVEIPSHYRSPECLLNELGIDEPADIRIEAVAQFCGATVIYEPLEGSDARLIGFGPRAFITVNSASSVARQRFSVAHELGHWMWDRGKMAFACGGLLPKDGELTNGNDVIERRANRYAVDLLLPEKLFYKKIDECRNPLSFKTITCISQEFLTSLTATAIRYVELAYHPSVLVACDRNRRRWYVRSPQVPRRLRLKEKIDRDTLAFKLLADPNETAASETLAAKKWIENEEAEDSTLREDSVKLSSDLVLTLLSWTYNTEMT